MTRRDSPTPARLDENDDPDRADFIRVQCRLADLSPAEPDWVDLTERQELVARLQHRFPPGTWTSRSGFYFGTDIIGSHQEPYHRGFPYRLSDARRPSGRGKGPRGFRAHATRPDNDYPGVPPV